MNLGETGAKSDELQTLCRPFPSERTAAWPASACVGNVKNDEAELVQPLENEPVGELGNW